MIYFDLENFFSILKISLILFSAAFAFFFPLAAFFGDHQKALRYSIPLSISIQIIFSYFFYSFGHLKLYPPIYLALVVILNVFSILKLKKLSQIPKLKLNKKLLPIGFLGIILLLPIIYTRFYDAATNIAPGAIDTYNHFQYLFSDLPTLGYLNYVLYPPGFHLFLYPLSIFINGFEIYRFAGPILGILTLLSIYLLFKDTFRNKFSKYLLLLLFVFPVFNQFILQTISFFPTALTFIFFPFLIYLLTKPKELSKKLSIIFCLLLITALSLTVPYFYAQLIPTLIFIILIIFIFIKMFGKSYLIYVSRLFAITFLGLFIAFGHVYLQTKILGRGGTFPITEYVYNENSQVVVMDEYQLINLRLANFFRGVHLPDLAQNYFVNNYLSPMLTSGQSILVMKNIRPLNNFLSIGAYFWTLVSVMICYLAIKQKNKILFIIATFSTVFGIIVITGMFEMSNYLGRSGWYLMFLALMGTVYLFDKFVSEKFSKPFFLIFIVLYIAAFFMPPTFSRTYITELFTFAYEVKKSFANQSVTFISAENRLIMISDNFKVFSRSEQSLEKGCSSNKCFLILESKFFEIDPTPSQQVSTVDKDSPEKFQKQQILLKNAQESEITKIKASSIFSDSYQKYWENENITVYEFNNLE